MNNERPLAPEDVALPDSDLSGEEEDIQDNNDGYEASDNEGRGNMTSKGKTKEGFNMIRNVARLIAMLPPEIRETYDFSFSHSTFFDVLY